MTQTPDRQDQLAEPASIPHIKRLELAARLSSEPGSEPLARALRAEAEAALTAQSRALGNVLRANAARAEWLGWDVFKHDFARVVLALHAKFPPEEAQRRAEAALRELLAQPDLATAIRYRNHLTRHLYQSIRSLPADARTLIQL